MDSTSDLQLDSLEQEMLDGREQHGEGEDTLLRRMARFRQNPFDFAHELYLFVRGVEWRSYNKQIGQPCFYTGYTTKIKATTVSSPLLKKKIEELAEKAVKREEQEGFLDGRKTASTSDRARRKAQICREMEELSLDMVDKMMCKMESKVNIRAAFYGVTQLLTRIYSGVHVSPKEVARLREVAILAAEKKIPIIFLPRHSSHIDYVTLQLVCYRLGLTLPVVVAGDNLNFPIVGLFLQNAGAMWIRRSFEGDEFYPTVVQAYLDTLLQQGYNMECFIEGGRSRTGKLLQPKFGILSFLLDSVLSGRTQDAFICPVSMQYDKVIEVDSYVTEMLGNPKQKENLTDFLSSSSILGLNMGRIDCRFSEPWSLKDFITEQMNRTEPESLPSVPERLNGAGNETRSRILRTLGYKVLADINSVSVVMPTALVGTVLLTLRGRGVGRTELARRIDWLCDRIRANGGNVADFYGMTTLQVADRALEVLGPKLVGKVDGLAEETYYAIDRFQLSFYRNMLIHLFIPEALIAAALYTKVKQGGGSASERISEQDLEAKVAFLSQLFRGEFIFPTGQGLRRNMETALSSLVKDDVLELITADSKRELGLSIHERQKGRENFDFYCFLIWPFVDAAWLGAVSLLCLAPPTSVSSTTAVAGSSSKTSFSAWISMKTAHSTAQKLGRTLYHQGDLSYFEAVNTEALKNAYSRFQEEGIIEVSRNATIDSTGSQKKSPTASGPVVRIAPDWLPDRDEQGNLLMKGRLWNLIDNVAQHRREGKGRRDGAIISERVLALAARLNQDLFSSQPDDDTQPRTRNQNVAETSADPTPMSTRKGRKRRSKL